MKPKAKEVYLKINTFLLLQSKPEGLTWEELSKALGISSKKKLLKLLGSFYMVGAPPYSPIDYIDLEYSNDRVRIHLPVSTHGLKNLRPVEWRILWDAISKESEKNRDPHLDSAQKKIKSIIPMDSLLEYQESKSLIWEAIRKNLTITFTYMRVQDLNSKKPNQPQLRTIQPWFLMDNSETTPYASSYLLGYCIDNKAPRVFRLDKMGSIQVTDLKFGPPHEKILEEAKESFSSFLKKAQTSSKVAGLWHTRRAYYYLNQTFQLKTTNKVQKLYGKEWIYSECSIRSPEWFLEKILGVLPDVRIESPDWLREILVHQITDAKNQLSRI